MEQLKDRIALAGAGPNGQQQLSRLVSRPESGKSETFLTRLALIMSSMKFYRGK